MIFREVIFQHSVTWNSLLTQHEVKTQDCDTPHSANDDDDGGICDNSDDPSRCDLEAAGLDGVCASAS